jgi:hypothetical protein
MRFATHQLGQRDAAQAAAEVEEKLPPVYI